MDNRKTIVSSALNIAGDALKFGIGLGALGVSKLNSALRGAISNGSEAVKSASATVGTGIHDAREATGHVAEAAEALIMEFGQSFKGQAGVPADEPNGKTIDAVANPVKPAKAKPAAKAKAATKSTAKAKPAAKTVTAKPVVTKAATPAKPKAATKAKVAGPAQKTESAAKAASVEAKPTVAAKTASKPAAKPAEKKAAAPKKAAKKPDVQAATSMAEEQTPPANKLH